jgi:hypothetical protein
MRGHPLKKEWLLIEMPRTALLSSPLCGERDDSQKVETNDGRFRLLCQAEGLAVGTGVVYEGPAPVGKGQAVARSGRRPGLGWSV